MKLLLFFALWVTFSVSLAQPNCEAYQLVGDTLKYKACIKAMEISGQYQFNKAYQTILDESLAIDPTFDYAYWAKSIAYLKSGDFISWKKLIDKAVALQPKEHLGYRGWCRYQFFRDYTGAIQDIETLDSLVTYDIGYSQNGTYHLNIAKGLCYKALGEKTKAISIIEAQILQNQQKHFLGMYDYLHLGVLYLETEQFEKALDAFRKQAVENNLAENQYYAAMTHRRLGNTEAYKSHLIKAKELYLKEQTMFDMYSNPMDKIYWETLEKQLQIAFGKNIP